MLNHCASEGREKKNAETERANEEWRKEGRDKSMKGTVSFQTRGRWGEGGGSG